jgi:hypothetical protein
LQHLGQVLLLFGRQAAQHFRAGTQNKTGPNRLTEKAPRSAWIKLLDQFRSFLVLVLLGATVLAGVVGDVKDAVVIGIVVILNALNALLGFFQEHRAEASLAALKNMLVPTARVRREGHAAIIAAVGLAPGDILLLEAGDRPSHCWWQRPLAGRLLRSRWMARGAPHRTPFLPLRLCRRRGDGGRDHRFGSRNSGA